MGRPDNMQTNKQTKKKPLRTYATNSVPGEDDADTGEVEELSDSESNLASRYEEKALEGQHCQ